MHFTIIVNKIIRYKKMYRFWFLAKWLIAYTYRNKVTHNT